VGADHVDARRLTGGLANPVTAPYDAPMSRGERVSFVGLAGELRPPGQIAAELRARSCTDVALLDGHLFGTIPTYARLVCHQLATVKRPWVVQADAAALDRGLLRLARRSGCRGFVVGPDPDPMRRTPDGIVEPDRLRAAAADLRRIRRAGLLSVLHLSLGRPGDDAGVFGRAVWLCKAGRVAFPRLARTAGDDAVCPPRLGLDEVQRGLEWARRALHSHRAIWRRTGALDAAGRVALLANYRARRTVLATPRVEATVAMRLARALARPIRIRERVMFVSTLVGAVHAGGGQVRTAWLRVRTMRDETLAALVIRLEGTLDARAARTLVARVRRAIGRTQERIVIDLGGLERVSSTVLTRFLEEHATHLEALRGRLAFRNLRPALDAVRRNLHGMLPNAALLEHALEEAR